MATGFRFPGGDNRTTVIGASGSGKTTCGAWLLAHQRFDRRPWIVLDFKQEEIFDATGLPPIRQLDLWDKLPKRPGLYLVSPRPGQEAAVDAWLWLLWERENVGLFIDEASLMPESDGYRAILQQGRSKRIPVIGCTQRPVDVKRAMFTEASYLCVYRVQDRRDARVVEGFVPADLSASMPRYWWRWYDVAHNRLLLMKPVPPPAVVADMLRARLPQTVMPFQWMTRPAQRTALSRSA